MREAAGVVEGLTRVRSLGELSCRWHNGTRGPLDLEGGGHLDTDCWWTEVTGEEGGQGKSDN